MMQHLKLIAALAALGCVSSANAADDLERRVTASDGWVAYRVPMISDGDGPCCYSVREGAKTRKGCDLDNRRLSFTTDDADPEVTTDGTLNVYLKVAGGKIERIRAMGASCPVKTASTIRWIDPVEPANSVTMLSSLIDRKAGDSKDHGFVAVAYHADSSALSALASRAEPSHPFKQREQALFWLGQVRGAEGANVIERYATTDPDPKLRGKALFALSQSKAPNAYANILKIGSNDASEDVRGEAYFWLAQTEDSRAKNDIIAALKTESSEKAREQAVFALSQLDDGVADQALIEVLRGDYPRGVKKTAMFWLGQSGSPQAMAYFDEALQ